MGFLIFALIVTAGIFLYIMADDRGIKEMNEAQTAFAVSLSNRLRRQVLGEQIFALDDAALTQGLSRFLQLRARQHQSPELALQSQKVLQDFPICLARVANGDVISLKSLMSSIRIETLGDFSSVADQCHRVLVDRTAKKSPDDALMSEAYKAAQDCFSDVANLIRSQHLSLPAITNIRTAVPLLSIAIFRHLLREAAKGQPAIAALHDSFEAQLQKGNLQAFNAAWPKLESALLIDAQKLQAGEFSNELERQFFALLGSSGIAGAEVEEALAAQIAIATTRVTQENVDNLVARHLQAVPS